VKQAPPRVPRVVWILARMRLRRWLNRVSGQWRKKKKVEPGTPAHRTATPGKSRGGWILFGFIGVLFFCQGIFVSWTFLGKLSSEIADARAPADLIRISRAGYESILEAEADLKALDAEPEDPNPSPHAFSRERKRQNIYEQLERNLSWSHVHGFKLSVEERESRAKELVEAFKAGGASRFHPKASILPEARFPAEGRDLMVRGIGLLLVALALCELFTSLGSANQDLGAVSWTLEWLFTFPVPPRALFLAQSFEHALVSPFGWFLIMPFLLASFGAAGFGLWTIPCGLAAGAAILVSLGASRVYIETWLRSRLPRIRIQNLQALLGILGILILFTVMWLALTPEFPRGFLRVAERFPAAALWNPVSLPALILDGGATAWLAVGALALCVALLPWLSAAGCERLVRTGLVGARGATSAGRKRAASRESRALLRGILAKEALVLLRDRNRFVQTLVIPVLVIGFQVLLNPDLLGGARSSFEHTAALAFGVGAYMLLFNATQVLALEGGALWILYTLPRALHSMLFQKTFLWCAAATSFTLAILCAGGLAGSATGVAPIWPGFVAASGVAIHAFIAAGLGVLATNPLETELARRVEQKYIHLYLFIGALFFPAIYSPSIWSRSGQLVLSSILAFAIWQKAREQLPYLLDPTAMPPRRISLVHGMLTILGYFALQSIATTLFLRAGMPPGLAFFLSFWGGGLIAGLLSIGFLLGIPGFFEAVGLKPRPGWTGRSLLLGSAGGVAAAAVGFLYVKLAGAWEPLRMLQEEALAIRQQAGAPDLSTRVGISLLVVFIVPLEEYIFRGLIFHGMRRSMGPLPAILLSAAVFSIFHPPFAALPVFVLGVVAAWARERTGYLLAPVIIHTIYNLAMVIAEQVNR